MAIGPFPSFAFPNVYTRTLTEAPTVTAAGGLRFPAFVGVADEEIPVENYEMIRGSSSLADNQIVNEDVSSQLDGTHRNFTVTKYPIVTGEGIGSETTNPNDVTVTVNGDPVPVASVTGSTGEIYLVSIPRADDEVLVTYYYKRTDDQYVDEDLSDQADGSTVIFKVFHVPIVQGDDGGITTTDPAHVTVKVNGTVVKVDAVDGDTGQITLASAPSAGDDVLVTYYSNDWQDTFDILPSPRVASISRVGLAPGSSDFINGTDFVLDTSGDFNTINWGHSSKVASGQHTIGTEFFDDTQITDTLYDNRVWKRETTSGATDGTNTTFSIEATPMSGQGLGYDTDDPSKITAYVGTSPVDATAVTVTKLNASARTITLQDAPSSDSTVFVTQYTNLLPDDTWTLTVTTAGIAGTGEYTMSGSNTGTAMQVTWSSADTTVSDPDFASENVTYPAGTGEGNRDTQIAPGFAPAGGETVSLTFTDASTYIVTSDVSNGTGSGGDNTGYLNQTYIDITTGFRVTVNEGTLVAYTSGDVIGYKVSPTFVTGSDPTRAIPGLRLVVSDTEDVGVGDTAVVNTYNKSGNEPNVGDFYYITFDETVNFDDEGLRDAELFTLEKNALGYTGPISTNNKLALAAHLAFLNGAAAIALLQIQKTTDEEDAPDSRYIKGIDYFNEPMSGGFRPALMQPVTTSTGVLSYLKTSNTIQSGIRYANERMSYFGFALNTTPTTAQTYARSLNNERMIGIYPDGAVTKVTDELGNDIEILVDGSIMAAAVAGRDTSPAFDVAEPLTRKPITGFVRLFRRMDSITSAQTANSGLTIIEEQAANMVVKIALTTETSSVLSRTPSVIRIKDFVQRGSRSVLQPFIGQKFLPSKTKEIEQVLGSYLNSLKNSQIIVDYTGVKATVNESDPTTVDVEVFYSPVLPLLWIVITYNLRSSL